LSGTRQCKVQTEKIRKFFLIGEAPTGGRLRRKSRHFSRLAGFKPATSPSCDTSSNHCTTHSISHFGSPHIILKRV
jgi:hypothetical protein